MILYNPTVSGSLLITGSLTTTGTLTAQTLVVQTITSSVDFVTGSSVNGSLSSNTHQFTGSVLMSGSLTVAKLLADTTLDGDPQLGFFTNASTGSSAEAVIYIKNGATTNDATFVETTGTGFTTTGGFVQNGGIVGTGTSLVGGLSLMVRGNANMRFYTNGHTNERMRITSTGNVGIGTSSPTDLLSLSGSQIGLSINSQTTGDAYIRFRIDGTVKTDMYVDRATDNFLIGPSVSSALIFKTNATERMRITSGGNVGINTSSPGYKLDVNGDFKSGTSYLTGNTTFFSTAVNGAQNYGGSTIRIVGGTGTSAAGIQFGPADTNTTGARGRIGFLASANNGNPKEFAIIKGVLDSTGVNTCNGSLTFHTLNGDNGTEAATRMTIDGNGSIGAASGTNIYNASDARLKKNISSISGSLNSVLALNPVKFNWVDDFVPSENGKDMLGFVAQEVQSILPEAVESFGGNSITIGDTVIDNPLRVNEKFIIPVLVKAIQELKAEIDTLKQQQ